MGKNILLVEDEAIIALNTKNSLNNYGYTVITAYSGEEAIKETDSNPDIDIVLMDINLGDGIDGTEAASVILERHNLPVIFVSSHEEPEIVEKTEKITNYGYVVKSSSITVLDASIKMAFKLFQAKREAAHELAEKIKTADQLRTSLDTLKYVIKQSKNAIAILDTELRYIYVSDGFISDYQLPVSEITGLCHYDVFPDLPERWKEIHQLALRGTASRADEDPYPKDDGTIAWVKWECLPWYKKEGVIGGIILNTEVITNEIYNAKVKDYMKMLKLTNAEKDKYISIMSHDLKGPLASFAAISEELAKNAPALTIKEIQEIGQVMHDSSRKLYSLLQNLLEWSKLNKGEVYIEDETICIHEEINETVSLFSRDAANKSIAIINEISPELMIAVKKPVLNILTRNILSNAIKFSAEASEVKITADLTDRAISITVSDKGIGFNQEDIINIFSKYSVKPQRGTFNEEGSGLGLILCNSLLEKYNGQMHLESIAGKGSIVSFTLPCSILNSTEA